MNTWISSFEIVGFVLIFFPLWGLKECINRTFLLFDYVEEGYDIVPVQVPGRDPIASLPDHIRPPPPAK